MAKSNASILIVDDEEAVRKFLATCLGMDYACVTAESAERAMELMVGRSFELVLTDLALPGISGVKLCEEIRKNCPDTLVIAMSGRGDIRSRVDAIRGGALYFVDKPFNTSGVLRLVESALNNQAMIAAKRKVSWSNGENFSVRTDTGSLIM
jgi:DNA-binding NtrC family response regulator